MDALEAGNLGRFFNVSKICLVILSIYLVHVYSIKTKVDFTSCKVVLSPGCCTLRE